MADLNRDQIRRLARLGAQARLAELRQEEAAIRHAFPDLFSGTARRGGRTAQASADAPAGRRKRRRTSMTAAARRAVSERMKKYWAERRKSNK
jgi:hypothetical protein